jgi:hypothetical protein
MRGAGAEDADAAATQPAAAQVRVSQPSSAPAVSERGPALYYATIQDGFYLSTQASTLRGLIDRLREKPTATRPADVVPANLLLYAAPGAAELIRPTVSYLLEQQAREVSLRNMVQVWLLGRCNVLARLPLDEAARNYLGYQLVPPDGGTYRYDPQRGEAISSVHGPLSSPLRLDRPPADSPLNQLLSTVETIVASLRFTEDGLSTGVEIRRR